MNIFHIDPITLPGADIIGLAQSGALCRIERETPSGGIPAFMPTADWALLEAACLSNGHHSPETLLVAVERATHRLLAHAAETLSLQPTGVIPVLHVETDLFPSTGEVHITFVSDNHHRVACVVLSSRPWTAARPTT